MDGYLFWPVYRLDGELFDAVAKECGDDDGLSLHLFFYHPVFCLLSFEHAKVGDGGCDGEGDDACEQKRAQERHGSF